MSTCIRCGSVVGEEYRFAHVETNTRSETRPGRKKPVEVVTEKLLNVVHASVCPACASVIMS